MMNIPSHIPDTTACAAPPVLLPYQQRWVADASPLKVMEKSRRTGPDKRIERIVVTVMGGDNAYLSPPDKHRQRRFQQFVQLLMERRFVDNNNTLTATQVRRAAGERNNTKAGVRKFDGVSLDVFVVVVLFPESFFNFTGRIVECPCPHRTRLNLGGKGTRYLHP